MRDTMVAPKYRSRSMRRVSVRTPRGTKIHYKPRNNKAGRCPVTGEALKGIPRTVSKCSKTQKRPQRPFGGVLSSKAMRQFAKDEARTLSQLE